MDETIKEKLLDIYKSMDKVSLPGKGDRWVNLAEIGSVLKQEDISYKDYGYKKLAMFIDDLGIFEIGTDESKRTPVKYIREVQNNEVVEGNVQKQPLSTQEANTANNFPYSIPEVGKYYKELIEEAEINWPEIVGLYEINKGGQYQISDIRDLLFHEHKYPDKYGDDVERDIVILLDGPWKTLETNRYYCFHWKVSPAKNQRGYILDVDRTKPAQKINARGLIDKLHALWDDRDHGAAMSTAMDTISSELMASSDGTFIYELLQNANDYPAKDENGNSLPVEVEFHLTDKFLVCRHSGEQFTPRDVASICKIGSGSKTKNKNAIGYKGIGFKTVFHAHDWVYIKTGDYTFRFDKNSEKEGRPFQIMPIWTTESELTAIDTAIAKLVYEGMNKFNVQTVMRPRKQDYLYGMDKNQDFEKSHEYILRDMFKDVRDIIFIPNIKSVKVFFLGEDPIICEKDASSDWVVSKPYMHQLDEESERFLILKECNEHPERRIPEKYKTFTDTYVSFAAKKKDNFIEPVEDATLYCYLPTKAKFGFPFLMNTDMVPSGDRNQLKTDVKFNFLFSKIAGRQFFYWIKDLIESQKYDISSIFSLIPDFDECKKRQAYYRAFIEEFQNEFETLIKEIPFVPVIDKNGGRSIKCIHEIINDMTELTADDVMSDEDFIKLLKLDDYCLPTDELRKSKSFKAFLYKHSPSDLDIKVSNIVGKCEDEGFQKWMSDIDNNTRFIEHWIGRKEIDKFIEKSIFIEYKGELKKASDLYYDFDTNCGVLECLRSFIPHLSPESKAKLETSNNWTTFAEKQFCKFEAPKMITDCILTNENALKVLEVPENSVSFYKYLAEKGILLKKEDYTKIPYIVEGDVACKDYKHLMYFYSDSSYALKQEQWIGKNVVNILSRKYFYGVQEVVKDNLTKLFTDLGFREFKKDKFVTIIIVGDKNFCANVNEAITDCYKSNKAFVDYVYTSSAQLKENSLKDYVLRCVDIKGNETYLCDDYVRYFDQDAYLQNSTYKDNTGHAWLKEDMMYALSNAYFESCDEEEAKNLQAFLRQQFGVRTFTDKSFFKDVVLKNKSVIYESLVDKAFMLTFLNYLKRDAERIFDGTLSFNDIKDMPLLRYEGTVINTREADVQYIEFNKEVKILCEKPWCPKAYVLLDKCYTDDFSLNMRQLFGITKPDINEVINFIVQLTCLKQSISTKNQNVEDQNVDFWRWVKTNQEYISSFDNFKMLLFTDNNSASFTFSQLYISDSYQKEQQDKIESIVKRYVPTANFVSSIYLESESEHEKLEWIRLFKKLGLKSGNKDILFSDILPNLSSFEEDSVVAMMTQYLKDLKEKWTEKRNQIIQLRVRARSGEYKTLDQLVIVNVDEGSVTEPFKYIVLSNEVDPGILKNNKELLLLISKEFDNQILITDKQMWIEAKVKDYLRRFTNNQDSIIDIHFQFIRELAVVSSDYKIDDTLRKKIKYRTKSPENTYMYAHEMTLGSAYSPTCDFEGNGVIELIYISNEYISDNNKDTIKSYFKGEGLHQDMTREDLKYLANRTFACYFWKDCFSSRLSEYGKWIGSGYFNNIVCIPTKNSVKTPKQLYNPHTVASYAVRAKISQWEEKIPFKEVVDSIKDGGARELFEKLDFLKALTFEDCLQYLERVNDKREEELDYRRNVIEWMLLAPSYNVELVNNYRKSKAATWRNGKGQKKHISELYAIHPNAEQERSIFGSNEYVIQSTCFPADIPSFEKICKILMIKSLKGSDFRPTPVREKDETEEMIKKIKPRLLVLSVNENPDNFQELYERNNKKLSQCHFFVCERIDLGYDTIKSDVERIYNIGNNLYYVGSWDDKRTYLNFCKQFKRLIGFNVSDEVCQDVLDDSISVESCIDKYCSTLKNNNKFQEDLHSLDLNVDADPEDEVENMKEQYYASPIDESGEGKSGTRGEGAKTATTNMPKNGTQESQSESNPTQKERTKGSNGQNGQFQQQPKGCYNPEQGGYIGPIKGDEDDQPQVKSIEPKHPEPYTKEKTEHLRSQGTPLELESLPPTKEELDLLAQCNIEQEQIADTNYLAQLRLYQNLRNCGEEPEETMKDFIHNAGGVAEHRMKNGKYIHSCSAANGVMYISPSVWNKMVDNKLQICVYLDGQGKNFHYIKTKEEFLQLVEKDDVVIKITGKEKVKVVETLYSGLLKDAKGTAYTLIRVASRTNMDAVFAHYIGAMAEPDDGNEDINEY